MKKITKEEKKLLDLIDKAQERESDAFMEGMKLKDLYRKKFNKEP